jgi:RNA polymerase sigma-70 factor (ECF subfamily)
MDVNVDEQIQIATSRFKEDPIGNFTPFYEATKRKIYFLIYSYTRDYAESEDLTQETYVRLLEDSSRFKVQHNPVAYLMTVAKHLAIDAIRKRKRNLELDEEGNAEVIGLEDTAIDESGPLLEAIKKCLSEFEFQVYIMRALSDLPFKEIAKELHRPVGTLTYTYSTAVDKLQKGLDKKWMSNLT